MPRLFHTSDTHLGHQQYARLDANGLNQREQDIYAAWHSIIDLAVAEKPDLFIHAGDLFDGVRPGNRALHQALQGFLKLSNAGIPTVVIAGNHEHPKLRETGSAFRLFEHLPNIHVAYQGHRETILLNAGGQSVRVHAVPQCADNETLANEVAAAPTSQDGLDLLVVHGGVPSLPQFAHGEFNELTLDAAWFGPFDYVALGHYHGQKQVAPNAFYCGAPERVSMSEAGQEKGFLDVHLGKDSLQATFRPVAGRVYVDLPSLECDGMDAAAVKQAAVDRLARVPDGAVARLRLRGLAPDLRSGLDVRAIQAAARQALHLDLRLEWSDHAGLATGTPEVTSLDQEFAAFAQKTPMPGVDRERILAKAREVLS